MYRTIRAVQLSLRPIIGSAASFLCSAFLIHHFACWLDPSFSLFSVRSVGKCALITGVLLQIALFISSQPRCFANVIWHEAVVWPVRLPAWRTFLRLFCLFACLHLVVLCLYYFFGYAAWEPAVISQLIARWPVLISGLVGTFLVAWSEEIIFRGVIFGHLHQTLTRWPSTIIAALFFSLSHDLTNPLRLLTTKWQLGLGLFLLGILLTVVRLTYHSIAAAAGAHAGLVIIKVILRKIPLLPITSDSQYLFPVDLRESLIVHVLMLISIYILSRAQRKNAYS